MKPISAFVPARWHPIIGLLARDLGVSKSEVIRRLIKLSAGGGGYEALLCRVRETAVRK